MLRVEVPAETDVQFLYFQAGMRYLTGSKDSHFSFDLLNFAILRYTASGEYEWVDNSSFLRKTNCSCMEGTLTPGRYLIYTEVEEESSKPED